MRGVPTVSKNNYPAAGRFTPKVALFKPRFDHITTFQKN